MVVFDPPPPDPRLGSLLAGHLGDLYNDRFYQSSELIERYGLDLAISLVQRLGLSAHLNEWRSVDDLLERLEFNPRFRFALGWLLARLADAELLSVETANGARSYRLSCPLPEPELEGLRDIGLTVDPANAATLDLLDAAIEAYPVVARGESSGEDALFGPAQLGLWLSYFSNDNPLYAVNNRVSAVAAADRLAEHRGIRILEIGAGAGSGTDALLKMMADRGLTERIERYLVTEPNPLFRRRGERMLRAAHPEIPLEFTSLDIDREWAGQGAQRDQFDLVYGVNILHVANDLLFTLGELCRTLTANGWMVMGECLRPFPCQPIWAELIFQILDGFIDVCTDDRFRPNPGFLSLDQWETGLSRAGIGHVEIAPDQTKIREIYAHFFVGAICARCD